MPYQTPPLYQDPDEFNTQIQGFLDRYLVQHEGTAGRINRHGKGQKFRMEIVRGSQSISIDLTPTAKSAFNEAYAIGLPSKKNDQSMRVLGAEIFAKTETDVEYRTPLERLGIIIEDVFNQAGPRQKDLTSNVETALTEGTSRTTGGVLFFQESVHRQDPHTILGATRSISIGFAQEVRDRMQALKTIEQHMLHPYATTPNGEQDVVTTQRMKDTQFYAPVKETGVGNTETIRMFSPVAQINQPSNPNEPATGLFVGNKVESVFKHKTILETTSTRETSPLMARPSPNDPNRVEFVYPQPITAKTVNQVGPSILNLSLGPEEHGVPVERFPNTLIVPETPTPGELSIFPSPKKSFEDYNEIRNYAEKTYAEKLDIGNLANLRYAQVFPGIFEVDKNKEGEDVYTQVADLPGYKVAPKTNPIVAVVAYRNEQGEMVKTPVRLPGDNRERVMTGLRLDLPEVINTTTGKAERATGKFRYVDPQTGALTESGTSKSDVIDVEETPWMEGRSMLDIVRSGNQIPVETSGVKAPSLMIDAAIEVGVGAKGFGNKFSMQVVPGVIGKGNERVGSGDIVFNLQDQTRRQTVSTRARAIQANPKNAFVQFLGGTFGGTDIGRQISLIETLFPENNKYLLEYMRDVQRRQNAVLKEFKGNPQGISENWVVPSLSRMAEANTADNPDNPQSMWGFGFELFKRFKKQMVVDPIGMYNRFGDANIKEPIWVSYGAVSENQRDFYLARLKQGAQKAVEEKIITKAQYEEMESNNFSNIYRFTPTTKEGLFNFEFNTPARLTTAVGREVIQWMNKGTKFNIRELQAMRQDPDLQQWADELSGEMPESDRAWRTLQDYWRYSTPTEGEKLRPGKARARKLAESEINELLSAINPEDDFTTVSNTFNHIISTTKGLLYNPKSGETWITPQVMRAVTPTEMEGGVEKSITAMGREYKEGLIQFLKGGSAQELNSPMNYFRNALDTLLTTSKDMGKQQVAKFAGDDSTGGGFVGQRGLGLNYAVVEEKDMTKYIRALAQTFGKKPSSRVDGVPFMKWARNAIEEAGGLPMAVMTNPVYSEAGGVQQMIAVTPKMARQRGLDIPLQNRVSSNMVGSLGQVVEKLFRDLDIDPAILKTLSPQKLEDLPNFLQEKVKALGGETYPEWEARLGPTASKTAGSEGQLSGWINSAFDMIKGLFNPEAQAEFFAGGKGMVELSQEAFFGAGEEAVRIKEEMGQYYREGNVLEAGARATGLWSEKGIVEGENYVSQGYAETLEQKSRPRPLLPKFLGSLSPRIVGKSHGRYEMAWQAVSKTSDDAKPELIGSSPNGVWDIGKTSYDSTSLGNWLFQSILKKDVDRDLLSPEGALFAIAPTEEAWRAGVEAIHGGADLTHTAFGMMAGEDYNIANTPLGKAIVSRASERFAPGGYKIFNPTEPGATRKSARVTARGSTINIGGTSVRVEDIGSMNGPASIVNILKKVITGVGPQGKSGVLTAEELVAVEQERQAREKTGKPADTVLDRASRELHGEEMQASVVEAGGLKVVKQKATTADYVVHPSSMPNVLRNTEYSRNAAQGYLMDYLDPSENLKKATVGKITEARAGEALQAGKDFEEFIRPTLEVASGADVFLGKPGQIKLTAEQSGIGKTMKGTPDQVWLTGEWTDINDTKYALTKEGAEAKINDASMVLPQLAAYKYMMERAATLGKKEFRSFAGPLLEGKQFAPGEKLQTLNRMYENALEGRIKVSVTSAYGSPEHPIFANNELIHEFPEEDVNRTIEAIKNESVSTIDSWLNPEMGVPNTKNLITTMQQTIDTTPGSPPNSTIWSNLSETYRNKLTEYVASGGRSQEEPVAREYRSPRERPRYPYQGMNRPTHARARGNDGSAEPSGGEPNRPTTPAGNVPVGNVPSGGGPGDTGGGGNARYLGPSRRKLSNEMAIMMYEKAESTYRNLTEGELGQEIMSLQDKYLEFAGQTMNVIGGWRWTGGSPNGQWESNGQYLSTQELRNSNQIRLGEVLGTMQAQFPDANKTFLNANQRAVNAVRGAGEILEGGARAAEQLQAELTPEQRAMGQQFTNVLSASNVGFPKGGVAFPNALVNIVEPSKDANKEEFDRLMKSSQGMRDAFKDLSKEMDRYTELSKDEVKNKKELNRMSQETIPQGKIASQRAWALAGIAQADKDLAALAPGDISQRTEYQAKRQAYQEQLVSADQAKENLANEDPGFSGDLRRVLGGFGIMYMKRLMSVGSGAWQAGLAQSERHNAQQNNINTLLYGAGNRPITPSLEYETQRAQLASGGGPLGSIQRMGNQFAGFSDIGGSFLTGLGAMELSRFASPMFKTIAPKLATGLLTKAGPIGLAIGAASLVGTQINYATYPEETAASAAGYLSQTYDKDNLLNQITGGMMGSFKLISATAETKELARKASDYIAAVKETGYLQNRKQAVGGPIYSQLKPGELTPELKAAITRGMAEGGGVPEEWAGINPDITQEVQARLMSGATTGINIVKTVTNVGAAIQAGRPIYEQANTLARSTTGTLLNAQQTVTMGERFATMDYAQAQRTEIGMQYANALPYTPTAMFGMTATQGIRYYETLSGIAGGQNEPQFTEFNQMQEAARRAGIKLSFSQREMEEFKGTNTWSPERQIQFGQELNRIGTVLGATERLAEKGVAPERVAQFGQWLEEQNAQTARTYAGVVSLNPIALGKFAAQVGGEIGQQASALSVTGYGLNGQATGLGLFSTSLNQGQITGTQTANRIWGAGGWQSSPTARGAVFGVNKETGQIYASDYQRQAAIEGGVAENMIVGGQRSIDYQRYWNSLNTQRAQIGVQFAQLALHEEYQPKFWALEDQQRALGYRQTEWGFGQQTAQMAMQTRQFGENMALQQQGMQMQRGWTQQDWAYQQNVRSMQWGWKQEDFAEQVRFMSGRERKLAERGMERETTMYNVEGDRIKTQQQRQKEAWRLEDERFELQKSQFTEQKKFQEEALERQKQFYEEGKALELRSVALNREYQEKQLELQKASLGVQAAAIEKEAELNLKAMELEDEQNRLLGNYNLMNEDAQKFAEWMDRAFKDLEPRLKIFSDWMTETFGKLDKEGKQQTVAPTTYGGRAMGGDIQPNTTYLAGEFGPELIRSKTIGSVISSSDLKTAMRNRWGDSVIASGAGGGSGSQPQVINIYLANEKFASYILNTVKKDLEVV